MLQHLTFELTIIVALKHFMCALLFHIFLTIDILGFNLSPQLQVDKVLSLNQPFHLNNFT